MILAIQLVVAVQAAKFGLKIHNKFMKDWNAMMATVRANRAAMGLT